MNSFLFQALAQKLPKRLLTKFGIEKKSKRKQSNKTSCVDEVLLSKFEATLLGALIGDCIGRKFEGIWGPNLTEMLDEFRLIKEKIREYDCESDVEAYYSVNNDDFKHYTDDTALTRAVCESLINKSYFDAVDMADCFQQTYIKEPDRGYASGAIFLFKRLNKLKLNNDLYYSCFLPAMEVFNGEGSYGNGAGMRCAPIALFTHSKSIDEMKLTCELATKLTHTHILGVIGAMQQCYAVRLALMANRSPYTFDFDTYFKNIINFVCELENSYYMSDQIQYENREKYPKTLQENLIMYLEQKYDMLNATNNASASPDLSNLKFKFKTSTRINDKPNMTYSELLRRMNKLILKCRKGEKINLQRLYQKVAGCGISAIESIPMALFAFLIAVDPKCSNEVNSKLNSKDAFKEYHPIERVIFYAISFGGESNKISSMAGAIAGAFFSSKDLPRYLIEMCESYKEAQLYAQKLFDISLPNDILKERDEMRLHKFEVANDSFNKS